MRLFATHPWAFWDALGAVFIVLGAAFVPIAIAPANILLGFGLLLFLTTGHFRAQLGELIQSPPALVSLGLFALLVAGLSYTSAPLQDAARFLSKYIELLLFPLFLVAFRNAKLRQWVLYAFLGTMAITLVCSYLIALGWDVGKGEPSNPIVFKHHITQSVLMALAAYLFALYFIRHSQWRVLTGPLAFLALYNVLFMTQSRSGYLVMISLMLLMLFQFFRWRGVVAGMLLILAGGIGAYALSDTVRERVDFTIEDLQHYQETGQRVGSTAIRMEFLVNTVRIISQNPWLGTGTGSYIHEYQKLREQAGFLQSNNPHNEYLMMMVQLGVPGLLAFIVFLGVFAWKAHQLPIWSRRQLHGLVVMMAVGCVINSFLMDFTEGHIFALLAAVWLNDTQTDAEESEK